MPPKQPKTCSVASCDRIVLAKGLCTGHYSRMKKHGDVRADTPLRTFQHQRNSQCSVDGCSDLARRDALCTPHYNRLKKTGSVQADVPLKKTTPSTCTAGDCGRPVIALGLCPAHHYRLKAWGDPRPEMPLRSFSKRNLNESICFVTSCGAPAHSDDLCELHYGQNRYLSTRYHMTVHQYHIMLEAQSDACAICKSHDPKGPRGTWHVDHDHACCPQGGRSCGRCVRALLCYTCNVGLGSFNDDLAVMSAAQDYIQHHRTRLDIPEEAA